MKEKTNQEKLNRLLYKGKKAVFCTNCKTGYMIPREKPIPEKCGFCGTIGKVKERDPEDQIQTLQEEIKNILDATDKIASKLTEDFLDHLKQGMLQDLELHVIIGVYSGIVNDIDIYVNKDKAIERERQLCKEYAVPFDNEERENYYDSCQPNEVKHYILRVKE